MKRFLKWVGISLVGALALLLLVGYFYDWSAFSTRLQQQLIEGARAQGIGLRLANFAARPFRASAKQAEIFARGRVPVVFSVEDLDLVGSLDPSLLQLVAQASAKLYHGTVSAELTRGLRGGDVSAAGNLKGVELQRHPQLKIFGLSSGVLAGVAEGVLWQQGPPHAGRVSVTVDRLDKPEPTRLPLHALGLPIDSPIPAIRGGRLKAEIQFEPDRILLSSIESTSSVWKFEGQGAVGVAPDRQLQSVQLELVVELRGEGIETLGPWLVLASEGKLPDNASRAIVRVSGRVSAPRVQILPVE